MFGAHFCGEGSLGVRGIAVLAFLTAALCRCGGSPSSSTPASAGSESPAPNDDTSSDGGLIFAQSSSSAVSDDAAASDASEGSFDASPEVEADTFTCDPNQAPKDADCIISDAYGVFVASPSSVEGGIGGSDDAGTGSMALPFATIGRALLNLNGKSRVYICAGVYSEAVSIDGAREASLYGGLTCTGTANGFAWQYSGAVAEVRPAVADHPALTISSVSSPLTIADMGFEAPATTSQTPSGAGVSSIAAWVSSSTVSFARVVLTAGDAARGADGTTEMNYDPSVPVAPAPVNSTDGLAQACPPGAVSPPADSTAGGQGSLGGPIGSSGGAYPPAMGTAPRDGLGGLSGTTDYAAPGDDGADGHARSSGIAAAALGTLATAAWLPAAGGDGAPGTPGQGGGGGGSLRINPTSMSFYFGGAGGTGGCGGGGGTGGKGGGASVALFSIESTVTLTTSQLASNQAGDGGNGGAGAPGQAGSAGHMVPYSGNGGMGGNGAGGSGGAGGTGGLSAGIAYQGSEPVSDATTIISLGHGAGAGAAGMGGVGGTGAANASGAAPNANAGAAGLPGAYATICDIDSP
jgi:hypothetical protein